MTQITRPDSKIPATVFAGVLAKAKALPSDTGATARAAARPVFAILVDVSASMADRAGETRKIDSLRASLDSVLVDAPSATVLAFNSVPRAVAPGAPLPEPSGGTALHLGLEAAAAHRRVLVISDGSPDSAADALRVAERIAGAGTRIDALFVGSDSDREGIAFMKRLAQVGGGETLTCDIVRQRGDRQQLASAIRRLAIAGPGGR